MESCDRKLGIHSKVRAGWQLSQAIADSLHPWNVSSSMPGLPRGVYSMEAYRKAIRVADSLHVKRTKANCTWKVPRGEELLHRGSHTTATVSS